MLLQLSLGQEDKDSSDKALQNLQVAKGCLATKKIYIHRAEVKEIKWM